MNKKSIYMREDIAFAMRNYNDSHNHKFNLTDLFTMEVILSNAYTSDLDLSCLLICSLSTVKRSINKLCNFGFITKHLAHDNTKSLKLHENILDEFLNKYLYTEPYYSEYMKLEGV